MTSSSSSPYELHQFLLLHSADAAVRLEFLDLHKYLLAEMVVLWRTGRETENTPTGDVVFSLSETYRAMWCPASWLGSTHPALSHHASFCPTSPLSPAALCIVIVLFSPVSLRLSLFTFPSSAFLVFLHCTSARLAAWPPFSPVRYLVRFCLSPLPSPYLPHEDSTSAQVDELAQSQRAGEEWEKFTRGQRREAEESRSKRHLEQVRQPAENAAFKKHFERWWRTFFMLQHPQRRHSCLPEERPGRQRALRPQWRRPVSDSSPRNKHSHSIENILILARWGNLALQLVIITVRPIIADWAFSLWVSLFVRCVLHVGLGHRVVEPDISLSFKTRPIASITSVLIEPSKLVSIKIQECWHTSSATGQETLDHNTRKWGSAVHPMVLVLVIVQWQRCRM